MTKARSSRPPIALAVRDARHELRMNQREMAEHLHVSRETMSNWECGQVVPPLERRLQILEAIAHAPPQSRVRIAEAFGLALPPPSATNASARAGRATAVSVIRAIADDLDVPASMIRKTLAAVFALVDESSVRIEDLRAAATAPPRKR